MKKVFPPCSLVFHLVFFSVPLAPRRWRLQALLEAWRVAFPFAFFFWRLIAFARFATSASCVSGDVVLDVWTCAAAEESQNRKMRNPTNFISGVEQFHTIGKKHQIKTARRQTRKKQNTHRDTIRSSALLGAFLFTLLAPSFVAACFAAAISTHSFKRSCFAERHVYYVFLRLAWQLN